MTKILVTGDRNWDDYATIEMTLSRFHEDGSVLVITGGAHGADIMADTAAKALGYENHVEQAQWQRYGKAAGPVRNEVMLDMKPDLVIAFHNDLEKSKGTRHCLQEAKKRGIDWEHHSTDGLVAKCVPLTER